MMFPKFKDGKPAMLHRAKSAATWDKIDREESQKVKARSGGRCEVLEGGRRCARRAFEVHHQKGGWKIRGRGDSALARNKTHCCSSCHREITGNVLELVALGGNRYRRIG